MKHYLSDVPTLIQDRHGCQRRLTIQGGKLLLKYFKTPAAFPDGMSSPILIVMQNGFGQQVGMERIRLFGAENM